MFHGVFTNKNHINLQRTISSSAISAESAQFPFYHAFSGRRRLLQLQNNNRNWSKNRAPSVIRSAFRLTADRCFDCNSISRYSRLKCGVWGGRRNARATATVVRGCRDAQRCSETGGRKKMGRIQKIFHFQMECKSFMTRSPRSISF